MRAEFAQAMIRLHDSHPNFVFVTGDLGYMALEQVQATYGERFVNAGVAEQSMISLAAGMASEGFIPWVYSIASFAVLRPYEQIRNDVCLHNLPVKIVGNGGGYGYGIMGVTHHTLEDIGVMRALPNMKVYVPLASSDVREAVQAMAADPSPNYLRLNAPAKVAGPLPPFQPWRRIKTGATVVLIGTGPVLGNVLALPDAELMDQLDIWSLGVFPVAELPAELVASIKARKKVVTLEEHGQPCGLNEALAPLLLSSVGGPIRYESACARGYPSGRFGNQRWHQEESGLAGRELVARLRDIVHG